MADVGSGQPGSARMRVVGVLALAFGFGLVVAWLKGPNTDGVRAVSQVRSALGNLSTPWLLVGFMAGAQLRQWRRSVLLGLAATVVALSGFYLLSTLLENLGGHGFFGDLRLELLGNRIYYESALVSGPVFGTLGAWWRRTRTLRATALAGGLMMAEPLVLVGLNGVQIGVAPASTGLPLLARGVSGWGLSASSGAAVAAVYAVEFGLGLVAKAPAGAGRVQ